MSQAKGRDSCWSNTEGGGTGGSQESGSRGEASEWGDKGSEVTRVLGGQCDFEGEGGQWGVLKRGGVA